MRFEVTERAKFDLVAWVTLDGAKSGSSACLELVYRSVLAEPVKRIKLGIVLILVFFVLATSILVLCLIFSLLLFGALKSFRCKSWIWMFQNPACACCLGNLLGLWFSFNHALWELFGENHDLLCPNFWLRIFMQNIRAYWAVFLNFYWASFTRIVIDAESPGTESSFSGLYCSRWRLQFTIHRLAMLTELGIACTAPKTQLRTALFELFWILA